MAVLAAVGAFNLVTFNRYFPMSEGWWETFGYLYNSGLRPYRDFELTFTPLFTIINAGLLRVFGDSFFAVRLFGVGVLLVAVFLLQLLVEQFFSPKTAAVAVTLATFLVISEPQFIAKDYHVYQLVLVALALLLHVRLATGDTLERWKRLGGTVLLGVTTCLVLSLKQNVGGLLLAGIAASLPFVGHGRPVSRVAAFAAGVALSVLLIVPVISPSELRQLLLANDAKGDIGTVLTRFTKGDNWAAITTALKISAAYAIARYVFAPPARWRGVWSEPIQSLWRNRLLRNVAFVVVIVLTAASGHPIRRFVYEWIIPATLAVLVLALYHVGRNALDRGREVDQRIAALVLPVAALAYANTTTAFFDFNGMHIPLALAIGWILSRVEAWAPPRAWAAAALALLIVVPEIVAAKIRVPYAWWGHVQASIGAARYEPPYPQLRRMYVSSDQRDTLDAIKRAVDTYSHSRSDVFFFNMPVFYWLHGKVPPFRTVVQWFDVVSSQQMESDIRSLARQPPRLVVALEPLPAAYSGHRRLKKQDRLPQEDFLSLMDEWVISGKYRLVRSIALPTGAHNAREEIDQDIVVQNARGAGLTLDAIDSGSGGVEVKQVLHGGTHAPAEPATTVETGDVLTVRGRYANVRALSEVLGVARGEPRDWNTVNIYVREDALADAGTPASGNGREAARTVSAPGAFAQRR